jgi:hypothetical protein
MDSQHAPFCAVLGTLVALLVMILLVLAVLYHLLDTLLCSHLSPFFSRGHHGWLRDCAGPDIVCCSGVGGPKYCGACSGGGISKPIVVGSTLLL